MPLSFAKRERSTIVSGHSQLYTQHEGVARTFRRAAQKREAAQIRMGAET